MSLKPLPPSDAELLFHPERDKTYRHFDAAADYPFYPLANGFAPVNAWWLADAALLAYWDADDLPGAPGARTRFANAGLPRYEFLQGAGTWTSTQCHVAGNDQFIIVAFRGTQADSWQDVFNDLMVPLVAWKGGPGHVGKVHAGFQLALQAVWPRLTEVLQRWVPKGAASPTVWFTGHSLGGALATLAADHYDGPTGGVYTFGSPLVGNATFASNFSVNYAQRSYRIVNDHDVVATVPPAGLFGVGYQHVEQVKYIDSEGHLGTPPGMMHRMVEDLFGNMRYLRDVIGKLREGSITLPNYLLDHTPSRYAVRVWNLFG